MMVCLIVATLGVNSLTKLPIDLMPHMENTRLRVDTRYEGAGPYEIETLITRPLEQTLSTVHFVERVSSQSAEGSSRVSLDFQWGTNIDNAINDIRQAIDRARELLPEDVEEPTIDYWDPADAPIIYLNVASKLDLVTLTRDLDKDIVPFLQRVPGVARIGVEGALRREVRVELSRDELYARDIAIADVTAALRRENTVQRSGSIEKGHLSLLLRTHGSFESLDDIADTIITRNGDAAVRVRDIGRVVDGIQPQTLLQRTNGKPSIALHVYKKSGLNTVQVCDAVVAAIANFNAQSARAKLAVRQNSGVSIRQAIVDVGLSLVYGMLLAALVLMVFLRSVRSTCVVVLSMPLSVLATLILIYFCGFSLNLVSFGGLALGIGLLVDNSIVVLESIFRKRGEGLEPREAAIAGTSEVAAAITASTITTLVVFLPALFLEGTAGVLLHQLAFVVSVAVTSSLLVSVTLTPVLTTFWRDASRADAGVWTGLERRYEGLLGIALRRPAVVSLVLLAVFACVLGMTPLIGTELVPRGDGSIVRVDSEMAPGVQLELLDHQIRILETAMQEQVPEADSLWVRVGGPRNASSYWHRSSMLSILKPSKQRERTAEEIRQHLETHLPRPTGVKFRVRAYGAVSGFSQLPGGDSRLLLELRGGDPISAEALATEVAAVLQTIPGLVNVGVTKNERREVLAADIDRGKASLLGISVTDVAGSFASGVRGTKAAILHDRGDELDVIVQLDEADRSLRSDIAELGVSAASGEIIPVKSVVSFGKEQDTAVIRRLDQQRVTTISAGLEGRDLGSAATEIQQRLSAFPLPDGYSINIAGDWKEQQKNFRDLRIGLLLAIALMYMVMASQFESLVHPLLVLLTLPLGAIGVIAALILTGSTFNVQSFIGVVMLTGIVVNNAIVLVDYINQLRRENPAEPTATLIIQAATRRFRPILMTTITTVLAMTPIALAWGESGEVQAPMACVVIGGLMSATLITLVAIPLAYKHVASPAERHAESVIAE
jgi:HAE1 family hydrophobic/amphiphilic exporter-1